MTSLCLTNSAESWGSVQNTPRGQRSVQPKGVARNPCRWEFLYFPNTKHKNGASNVAWKICFFKLCLGSWIIGSGFQADRTLLVAVSATRQSRNYIATGRTLITDHSPILAQLLVQKLPLLFPPQKFSQGCSGKGSRNKSLGMKRLSTFKLLKLLYNEVPFVLYRLLSEVFQPFQQALDVILAWYYIINAAIIYQSRPHAVSKRISTTTISLNLNQYKSRPM